MNKRHGGYRTPEYTNWRHMHRRCRENYPRFDDWGGRGIAVCERWRAFENFLADMGPRPTPQHTVERIDNSLGYEPDNCKWATPAEQARNHRKQRNNTSGVTGVRWHRGAGKWMARIKYERREIYLGLFTDLATAAAARQAMAAKLGFNPNHGETQ